MVFPNQKPEITEVVRNNRGELCRMISVLATIKLGCVEEMDFHAAMNCRQAEDAIKRMLKGQKAP